MATLDYPMLGCSFVQQIIIDLCNELGAQNGMGTAPPLQRYRQTG